MQGGIHNNNNNNLDIESFKSMSFESETMKFLIKMEEIVDHSKLGNVAAYNVQNMFPNWIINDPEWKLTESRHKENEISLIMRIQVQQRTQEQISTLVHWLMSVWETANLMGFKRCGAMTKVFHFLTYESGENIITEGERGLTFYIVISGQCAVHKEGIGVVAGLQKGQSFGELALTEGKDLRSATVKAVSRVELLRLHKVDYDHFVKDIQLAERRENLQVLRSCKLFENWSRSKVQKMVTTCLRKSVEANEYVFHQGDVPDNIYFIVEGTITIIKEIHIVVRNRWPTDIREWDGVSKTKVKPYIAAELTRGAYFGELSIIKNKNRTASAKAKTRCTLLCLDKLEFVHLLRSGKTMETISHFVGDYEDDRDILDRVVDLKGGPSTTAQLNEYVKTAEDHGNNNSPMRPYSSPTPGDRSGNFSPNGKSKILRIPTGVYEKTGPNHGLQYLNSPKSSPPPTNKRKSTLRTQSARAAAKFAGLSRTVAKFKEIKAKVNKSKIPSVQKFRRQLLAAAEATQANHIAQNGGVGGSNRNDDGLGLHNSYDHTQPIMVEEGKEFMRHVMEDVIQANRKIRYFKNQVAPKSVGGLKSGELGAHKSLRFSFPNSVNSPIDHVNDTQRTTFYLNQDIHNIPKETNNLSKSPPHLRSKSLKPNLQFPESSSQPILTTIDSVVLKTASGRKIKSKDIRDINEYVGATVQGRPLPIKDISLKQRNLGSNTSGTSQYPEYFELTNDQNENNLRKNHPSLQRQETHTSKLSVHASTIKI
mmetsp:Transcript_12665/g.13085  ORF Transcript_12665/g.13085 Transcript_12665/m.13085 type:complete len:764 (-) Transcript_12665:27-2318(-)